MWLFTRLKRCNCCRTALTPEADKLSSLRFRSSSTWSSGTTSYLCDRCSSSSSTSSLSFFRSISSNNNSLSTSFFCYSCLYLLCSALNLVKFDFSCWRYVHFLNCLSSSLFLLYRQSSSKWFRRLSTKRFFCQSISLLVAPEMSFSKNGCSSFSTALLKRYPGRRGLSGSLRLAGTLWLGAKDSAKSDRLSSSNAYRSDCERLWLLSMELK